MAGSSPTWYKWVMLIFAYGALYLIFIGEAYLIKTVEMESQMNRIFFSEEVAKKAEDRGTVWFTKAFIDTQIMAHTFEPFIPTEEEMANAKGMEGFAQPVFDWFEGRIRAWWTMVWSTFTRLSTVLLWAPYAIFMIVPWVIDGWVQRERSKHTFEFSSPVKHRYAMMALMTLPLVFFAMLTAPLALNPLVTPAIIFGIGALLYSAVANFMKRA